MILIHGKNGSGKTYLASRLTDYGFSKIVSYTTREMRNTEVNGVDYNFISKMEFENLIKSGFFLEYKKLGSNYYGTPINMLNDNAIAISSNLNDLKKFYNGNIDVCFIDAPLAIRYNRVKKRGVTNQDLFMRFNTENYDFLYDFNGYFIDNSIEDDSSLNSILSIGSKKGIIKSSNISFLKRNIACNDFVNTDDEMLLFLQYEEYLLRNIFLSGNANAFDIYFYNMRNFTNNHGIRLERVDEKDILVTLNKEDFISHFDENKILVKK